MFPAVGNAKFAPPAARVDSRDEPQLKTTSPS
jgi:hypothetical protein